MDFQSLFLTSDGRLPRGRWWMGTILLIIAGIVITIILGLVGLGFTSPWGPVINYALLFYPTLNIGLKRRHDRDSSGTDYMILMGLWAVVVLLQAFGIGFTRTDLGNGMVVAMPDTWMNIVQLLIGLYGIYMLVMLGFLKGTTGANSYGPDPLG